jgi:Glycine-rich domain-containing protein-like
MASAMRTLRSNKRRPTLAHHAQVHSGKLLLDPMVVANAVRRYETCWLPLVAAHAATRARSVLAPPLDVAWVWLLHALDPVSYAAVWRGSSDAYHSLD